MTDKSIFQEIQVVIVDDDENSLEISQILLEEAGASVLTAMNGKEGLELIERVVPALIICDISMPIMDGWEVVRQIRTNHKLKNIPVIALTAHAMTGDREKTLAAGFHNYISKPLIPSEFIGTLVLALSNHPAFRTS